MIQSKPQWESVVAVASRSVSGKCICERHCECFFHIFVQRTVSLSLYLLLGPTNGPTKIAQPAVFQAVWRGIGKSFQSAITAPRMNLTGYGNATAQS